MCMFSLTAHTQSHTPATVLCVSVSIYLSVSHKVKKKITEEEKNTNGV